MKSKEDTRPNKSTIRLSLIIVFAAILVLGGVSLFTKKACEEKVISEKTCTTFGGRLPEICAEDLIGLHIDDLYDKAQTTGHQFILVGDGRNVYYSDTTDFGSPLIAIEIRDDIIVNAYF